MFEDDAEGAARYDAVVTYSSVEHAGLGRYGDPLDPDGDVAAMAPLSFFLSSAPHALSASTAAVHATMPVVPMKRH